MTFVITRYMSKRKAGPAFFILLLSLGLALFLSGPVCANSLLAQAAAVSSGWALGVSSEDLYSQGRGVAFDFDLLANSDDPGQSLSLDLFGELALSAELDYIEERGAGDYSWFGHLAGDDTSLVVFTVTQGAVSGLIQGADGTYSLRTQADGSQVLWELNPSQSLPGHTDPWVASLPEAGALYDQALSTSADFATSSSTLDIMILFSDQAAAATGDMGSLAQLGVDVTNAAFARSGIASRLNLVNASHIAYSESGSSSTELSRLRGDGDGFMDEIHGRRNDSGADLVSLWVKDLNDGTAGIAYLLTNTDGGSLGFNSSLAFNVVDLDYAIDNLTFTHEVGHNLGAHHDWYVSGGDSTLYSYSHGYVSTSQGWYTVMSYASQLLNSGWKWEDIQRIAYFSNPGINYNGEATGVAEGNDFPADNARTINQAAGYVSTYR